MTRPTYAELITIFETAASVRSVGLTEKRIDVILDALRIAEALEHKAACPLCLRTGPADGVAIALLELLQYNGGWDLQNPEHPIVKARRALECVGVKL